ncbi:hypothetical protein Amsp01_103490 [Amycolatopsis sp. NBRC 101858]|uniref:hypothetical protein n=1 Tax=Amycolatopsis sp. NBRC 101858 TaxID=3032200 RepID=UPI0024A448E8|nr:hypothetical protein [Amycolatopsis sp. NBRC 101858]GLY44326.1 hypothetical protein Amsp01_103490 [Amycolatopsis sp. NBRC 101858]
MELEERVARLDTAGGKPREEAQQVLRALLKHYERGDDEARAAIRALFDRYPTFTWATHLPRASFRTRLLHLSACDHGRDTRDEILRLNDICTEARAAGVDIGPLLREVAELSSTVDKYGMGSMRDILLRSAE